MKNKISNVYVEVKEDTVFPPGFFPKQTKVVKFKEGFSITFPEDMPNMTVRHGQTVYKHLRYVVFAD